MKTQTKIKAAKLLNRSRDEKKVVKLLNRYQDKKKSLSYCIHVKTHLIEAPIISVCSALGPELLRQNQTSGRI